MVSTSDPIYVWTWLPGHTDPVPAGALRPADDRFQFGYAQSYLDRPEAMSLYAPELPLRRGWVDPPGGQVMPSCLRDGAPDAWGRRVILDRAIGRRGRDADPDDVSERRYLLEPGSNRFGANDFQARADLYAPRHTSAALDELHEAAQRLAAGEHLTPELAAPLVHGTSVGGARPKATLADDAGREYIAKFSMTSDHFPVVNAEAAAMLLADRAGLDVPSVDVTESLGRDVLVVERFDRPGDGTRRHTVSGLTLVGLDERFGHYATYPDMLDVLRSNGALADVGAVLYERVVFNVAVGNTDDHARNHAAFWDGQNLTLTPAYDLCPQARVGETAYQAMAYDRDGTRASDFSSCLAAAPVYGLTTRQARALIDHIVEAIHRYWSDVADQARLTESGRAHLWQHQILNPSVFYGY